MPCQRGCLNDSANHHGADKGLVAALNAAEHHSCLYWHVPLRPLCVGKPLRGSVLPQSPSCTGYHEANVLVWPLHLSVAPDSYSRRVRLASTSRYIHRIGAFFLESASMGAERLTTIVLPGGCYFSVYPPTNLLLPYYPLTPRLRHVPGCRCVDEDGYMDDDSVFMSVWLSHWEAWNAWRVVAPELRGDRVSMFLAREGFCRPHVEASRRLWGLPCIGSSFRPSSLTLEPIEWFWRCLDGARDLAHCQQPGHAVQFHINTNIMPSSLEDGGSPDNYVGVAAGNRSDSCTVPDTSSSRRNRSRTTHSGSLDSRNLPDDNAISGQSFRPIPKAGNKADDNELIANILTLLQISPEECERIVSELLNSPQ